MIKEKILNYVRRGINEERSAHRLALSVSIGTFIAFSPYHFFHTIMIFLFAWLLSLNLVVTFAVTYALNNPWTMAFVYSADYLTGDYILNSLGLSPLALNPCWMEVINEPLRTYTGIDGIAFWSFMLGGNLLGLLFGVMLYPIVKQIYIRMSGSNPEVGTHENNYAE